MMFEGGSFDPHDVEQVEGKDLDLGVFCVIDKNSLTSSSYCQSRSEGTSSSLLSSRWHPMV
eukprot:scaffold20424_cov63-Skeletonema_menzelii.AAC.1